MTDPMGKVTEQKDLLGKLKGFVSGFVGYFDRENRRDADRILRETIVKRYEEQWSRVSALQAQMTSSGKLEWVDDMEKAAVKLRGFIDRVEGAASGYAGFFDAVRVKQDELDKLYSFDLALLENADKVRWAVDELEADMDKENFADLIEKVVAASQTSVDLFNRRDEAILTTG